jgi:hypothetical protein
MDQSATPEAEKSTSYPTSGRSSVDWGDRSWRTTENGNKIRMMGPEDRLVEYQNWHRTLGVYLVAADVDQVEWRDGEPVAILELTRADDPEPLGPGYFREIMRRKEVDRETRRTLILAQKLDVQAFLVVFRKDLSEFWVWRVWPLQSEPAWKHMVQGAYATWLRGLKPVRSVGKL